MDYQRSTYRMELFVACAIRTTMALSLLGIITMFSGCSNMVNIRGIANRDVVKQTGQFCLGLKADSESCTPIGGNDEKSDSAPLKSAS